MPDQPNGVIHDAPEISINHDSVENQDICNGFHDDVPVTQDQVTGASQTAGGLEQAQDDSPRGTKRKLSTPKDSAKGQAKKQASPPWARFEPKNPTAFNENGLRKSGRTNALPLDSQPQGATRGKSAAYLHGHESKRDARSPTASKKKPPIKREASPRSTIKQSPAHAQHHQRVRSLSGEKHKSSKQGPKSSHARKTLGTEPSQPQSDSRRKSGRQPSDARRARPIQDTSEVPFSQPTPDKLFRPGKTLRLNFRRPPPPLLSVANIPVKKTTSLQESIEQKESSAEDGGERPLTHDEARKEARIWQRLERAARPGGAFQADPWRSQEMPAQAEPTIPATHPDFLLTHIKMFVRELNSEQARHRRNAKSLADAAQEKWKSRQPEYVLFQQRQELAVAYRAVMGELSHRWGQVEELVKQRKLKEHEEQQQRKVEQDLTDLVDRSQLTSRKRRRRQTAAADGAQHGDVDAPDDPEAFEFASSGDSDAESGEESSDSDDDMTSSDGDVSEAGALDDSTGLTGEALYRHIYGKDYEQQRHQGAHSPSETSPTSRNELKPDESFPEAVINGDPSPQDSEPHNHIPKPEPGDIPPVVKDEVLKVDEDVPLPETDYSTVKLDEVDDALMEEDDDRSESDSGTEESSEQESSGEGDESSSEEETPGLMGFFGRSTREALQKPAAPPDEPNQTIRDPDPVDIVDADRVASKQAVGSSDQVSATDDANGQDTPNTMVESKGLDTQHGAPAAEEISDTTITESTPYRTPVPPLLRGQLREYQHHGLDWLAGMYDSDTNGILADEMGLGKTIQTIALLAHLAVEKLVWGPHLIVVPTSVILNWEMEFKKFCPGFKILTYYGNQEERREKRKGWMDDDRWHVCITSYQLALADQSSLKRRNWHYIVLDEAHNIKNFRSQRWQTLLTFKSQARLLLTGTPLQNNLTELWSLLFFLAPESDEYGETRFKDLKSFSSLFKRPVEQILDNGREALDDQAKEIVTKLHHVLRPHLLRRLKADVEQQMPKKYEHVVRCRLSKRQRQLYDGYMGLAGTKDSFASGNYMSIINCLMQLRKVCNHPDLFETRPIVTSFAMPKSAVAQYEINELLIRRTMLDDEERQGSTSNLINLWRPNTPSLHVSRARQLGALNPLKSAFQASRDRSKHIQSEDYSSLDSARSAVEKTLQDSRTNNISTAYRETAGNLRTAPVLPIGLLERFLFDKPNHMPACKPTRRSRLAERHLNTSTILEEAFSLNPAHSQSTEICVRKFGCITPAVVAPGMAALTLNTNGVQAIESTKPHTAPNPYHEAQTRLSIAFPDRSLIQYDCGKLQQLDRLLRKLQAGGHRALIFTQMTRVLDILEQFLNLHGHRYLRLDGSTRIESRQALTDQFNTDPRVLAFILSSRSGGLGINLTGADTVIFYDLDWNPAMDKQCQDRCHRIGQTRDVHIYRFVSEGTIEANILRKSNQKRMLDDVVIQEGEFTTDAFYRGDGEADQVGGSGDADAAAALDKVFGGAAGEQKKEQRVLEQAEDQEDVVAARQAEKEIVHEDEVDFQEKTAPGAPTPDAKFELPRPQASSSTAPDIGTGEHTPGIAQPPQIQAEESTELQEPGHYEDYMIKYKTDELRDAVIVAMSDKQRRKSKKGKEHGVKIVRR